MVKWQTDLSRASDSGSCQAGNGQYLVIVRSDRGAKRYLCLEPDISYDLGKVLGCFLYFTYIFHLSYL